MKCLAQAITEKSSGQDFQGEGHCGKVRGRRNVTFAHTLMKMSSIPSMKCLAQAIAEKLCGQDFQGQGHCGKVKGQRNVTLAHPLNEDESIPIYTSYIPYPWFQYIYIYMQCWRKKIRHFWHEA